MGCYLEPIYIDWDGLFSGLELRHLHYALLQVETLTNETVK